MWYFKSQLLRVLDEYKFEMNKSFSLPEAFIERLIRVCLKCKVSREYNSCWGVIVQTKVRSSWRRWRRYLHKSGACQGASALIVRELRLAGGALNYGYGHNMNSNWSRFFPHPSALLFDRAFFWWIHLDCNFFLPLSTRIRCWLQFSNI
jgi:hypothetical protein